MTRHRNAAYLKRKNRKKEQRRSPEYRERKNARRRVRRALARLNPKPKGKRP